MSISNVRNSLLAQLPTSDLAVLSAHLEPVDLPKGLELASYNEVISHHYFIEVGVGSMVAVSPSGMKAEVGLVGREGITPIAAVLGCETMPYESMMQIGGRGTRIESAVLADIIADRPTINRLFLRYCQSFIVQMAYTALTNVSHNVDVRLARWLLMCHDRMAEDDFALTHEFMSIMLGVRRSSVTDALHILEGKHLIYSQRGRVVIRSRRDLEYFASDAYGVPEREYQKSVQELA
jgi:CRP-like cAMP-binding protein